MATYYNLFSLGTHVNPVVSVPYVDAFGTGNIHRSYPDVDGAFYWFKWH